MPNISIQKEKALFNQLILEKKFCQPKNFGKYNFISSLVKNFSKYGDPFFSDDFGTKFKNNYPYPTKMPSFLCMLGIYEIERWEKESQKRKELSKKLIHILKCKYYKNHPNINYFNIYNDTSREIIPLDSLVSK